MGMLYQVASALVCVLAVWFLGVLAWWVLIGHATGETADTLEDGDE